MQITLNGERRLVAAETLGGLLVELGLQGKRLAVEVNEAIVPRSEYPSHRLHEGDRVEVVHAIGGG